MLIKDTILIVFNSLALLNHIMVAQYPKIRDFGDGDEKLAVCGINQVQDCSTPSIICAFYYSRLDIVTFRWTCSEEVICIG